VVDAVISGCATRSRPIIITALALVVGSSVILSDPIFQGMAVSLMFGGAVSTVLTLVVIPLGCVSFRKALCETCDMPEEEKIASPITDRHKSGSFWRGVLAFADFLWLIVLTIGLLVITFFKKIYSLVSGLFGGKDSGPSAPPSPPPAKPTAPAAKVASPPPPAAKPAPKSAAAKAPKAKAKPAAKPKTPAKTKAAPKAKAPAKAKAAPKAKAPAKPKAPAKRPKATSGRRGIRIKPTGGGS